MAQTKILIINGPWVGEPSVEDLLTSLDYAVLGRVSSGPEALAQVEQLKPDLVLLELPDKADPPRIELAGQIHARLGLPVVFLSDSTSEGTYQQIQPANPSGYLVKPFDGRELQAAIESALTRQHLERELSASVLQSASNIRQFQAVLANMSEGLILADLEGNILEMNPAARTLPPDRHNHIDEIRSLAECQRTYDVYTLDGRLLPDEERPMARVQQGESFSNSEYRICEKETGQSWIATCSGHRIGDAQGKPMLILLTFRNITAQKEAEQALHVSYERLKILTEAAHQLILVDEPKQFLVSLFERVAEHLGLEVYSNYLVTEDGKHLHLFAYSGFPDDFAREIELITLGESISGRVAQQRQHMIFEDVGHSKGRLTERIRGMGLQAYASFPLLAHDHLIGTLSFGSRLRSHFDPDELELMETLSSQVAVALDRSQLVSSLWQRGDDLADRDRRKDEFLAMLAHELRNPLAPIQNAVEVMRLRHQVTPELEYSITLIERQTRHMVRLVDDLLEVSRVTRGQIQLRKEYLDARTIMTRAVEDQQSLFNGREQTVSTILPPQPVWLEADAVRLEQVLVNLLNNASKYTPLGGQIWAILEQDGKDVVLRVRDTGIGIPPELLPTIFNPFIQADRSLDRAQGGLGLGLTLVRRLVEMHQGTILVTSPGVNQGSEFIVRIPSLASAPELTRPQPTNFSQTENHGRHVLIVEDNVDTARSIGELLELWGHEVYLAYDGPMALAVALEKHPEAVLLDIGLPGMDGYQVAQAIRRHKGLASALIIATTGYGQAEDKRRSHEAGIDHHLIKPIDLSALKQLLA